MTVEEYIKILERYPKDATVIMSYIDFYGECNCIPITSYNGYSNTLYVGSGESIDDE